MAVKAKRFRIGVEGTTTDGRNIERAWLEQMAAGYDPQGATALINLEHIKGYTPDSPFRRFGTVDKLEAEEIADGQLKGKMALYAWITPSEDLVAYTRNLQKLFMAAHCCRDLIHIHSETAISANVDNCFVRSSHLGTDRGSKSVSHCSETTGSQESTGFFVLEVLCGPHLVLTDIC